MNLRDLCRCTHVRGSHDDRAGRCRTCECARWSPAYPVFDVVLPAGVDALAEYATGLTLVQCRHVLDRERSWCPFCFAEPWMTDGFTKPVKRLVFAPEELRLL